MKPCPSPDCDAPPDEPPTYIHADRIYVECGCGVSGPHGDCLDEALQLWNDLPRADGLAQATEIAAKVVADKRVVDLQQELDRLQGRQGTVGHTREIRCDFALLGGGGLYCETHAVGMRGKQDCVCDDGLPIRCPAGQWQENTRHVRLELEQARDDSAAVDAFDKIAELCGCPEWEYPGQLVRDVEALAAKRDSYRAALRDVKRQVEAGQMTLTALARFVSFHGIDPTELDDRLHEQGGINPAGLKEGDQ